MLRPRYLFCRPIYVLYVWRIGRVDVQSAADAGNKIAPSEPYRAGRAPPPRVDQIDSPPFRHRSSPDSVKLNAAAAADRVESFLGSTQYEPAQNLCPLSYGLLYLYDQTENMCAVCLR